MCKLILQNNTAEPNQNQIRKSICKNIFEIKTKFEIRFVKYFRSKKYINKKHYNTNILIFHLEKE